MSRCVRQWRSLKQIKRGGGGHFAAGLAAVPNGAFAVECPACPHPGRNLPEGWDQAPDDIQYAHILQAPRVDLDLLPRWLYACFLAVDANFRLKLKSRGIADPEVGSGWSYFVENERYQQHVSRETTEVEVGPPGFFIPNITLMQS